MSRVRFAFLVIAIGIAGLAPTGGGQAPGAQVFAGATLFDGTGARIENAVMVVINGRIASVGRSDAVTTMDDDVVPQERIIRATGDRDFAR
jgi:hypothetical protein